MWVNKANLTGNHSLKDGSVLLYANLTPSDISISGPGNPEYFQNISWEYVTGGGANSVVTGEPGQLTINRPCALFTSIQVHATGGIRNFLAVSERSGSYTVRAASDIVPEARASVADGASAMASWRDYFFSGFAPVRYGYRIDIGSGSIVAQLSHISVWAIPLT